MIRAHRIRLAPNNVQATCLSRAAGVARFAYNWALDQWQQQYAAAKIDPALPKPNETALRRQLNAIKHSDFPWMLEVTKNAPQMAKQLDMRIWARLSKTFSPNGAVIRHSAARAVTTISR